MKGKIRIEKDAQSTAFTGLNVFHNSQFKILILELHKPFFGGRNHPKPGLKLVDILARKNALFALVAEREAA